MGIVESQGAYNQGTRTKAHERKLKSFRKQYSCHTLLFGKQNLMPSINSEGVF